MAQAELVVGDGGSVLHVLVRDSVTKEPITLTGKTIKARYSVNGGSTVEKTMTALDQTSKTGQAEYTFLTTDLAVAGTLIGEVRLQAGLADQLTSVNDFYIVVKAPLP